MWLCSCLLWWDCGIVGWRRKVLTPFCLLASSPVADDFSMEASKMPEFLASSVGLFYQTNESSMAKLFGLCL